MMDCKICACSNCVSYYRRDYLYTKRLKDCNLYFSHKMHIVWYGLFIEHFTEVSNLTGISWSLLPDVGEIWDSDDIKFWTEKFKVRFHCSNCQNVWTSMLGLITFRIVNGLSGKIILFKILSQRCSNCKSSDYSPALTYPEEIEKVLMIAKERILKKHIYISYPSKTGNPRGFHHRDSCEGCFQGKCFINRIRTDSNSTCYSITRIRNESACFDSIVDAIIDETDDWKSQKSTETSMKTCFLTVTTSDYESEVEELNNSINHVFQRSISLPYGEKNAHFLFHRQLSDC